MSYLKQVVFFYSPRFMTTVVYMLQSAEYEVGAYLRWFWRTTNFTRVMYRRQLHRTRRARLLRAGLLIATYTTSVLGVVLALYGLHQPTREWLYFGIAIIAVAPLLWSHLITIPLLLARWFIVLPKERQMITAAQQTFADFKGPKIAIAGSYGKTTMKELLWAILSEGKQVAATPGNKNVTISHALFARKLTGHEDILLIEYGEGRPGDIARFATATRPTHAIITGLAPAHLDHYKTLDAVAQDLLAMEQFVAADRLYINKESSELARYVKPDTHTYSRQGALGWRVTDVTLSIEGMSFVLQKGKKSLRLHTELVGEHLLGPLALAAAVAHELGLTEAQIVAGVAKTKPYEHRMQPYMLGGGWVIDDSYNGNLEGVRAGTALLAALDANRKVYVTPGLVEQGKETERVHLEMGRLIAAAKPDEVVLMRNSVTDYIRRGLEGAGYRGEIRVQSAPLEFYQNIEHTIAAGNIFMLQNDWPDNYA